MINPVWIFPQFSQDNWKENLPSNVKNYKINFINEAEKMESLMKMFDWIDNQEGTTVVFCNSKKQIDFLTDKIKSAGGKATGLVRFFYNFFKIL